MSRDRLLHGWVSMPSRAAHDQEGRRRLRFQHSVRLAARGRTECEYGFRDDHHHYYHLLARTNRSFRHFSTHFTPSSCREVFRHFSSSSCEIRRHTSGSPQKLQEFHHNAHGSARSLHRNRRERFQKSTERTQQFTLVVAACAGKNGVAFTESCGPDVRTTSITSYEAAAAEQAVWSCLCLQLLDCSVFIHGAVTRIHGIHGGIPFSVHGGPDNLLLRASRRLSYYVCSEFDVEDDSSRNL